MRLGEQVLQSKTMEKINLNRICCPICLAPATNMGHSPNGGVLYVAEDFYGKHEAYNGGVTRFSCDKNKDHVFYIEVNSNGETGETNNE